MPLACLSNNKCSTTKAKASTQPGKIDILGKNTIKKPLIDTNYLKGCGTQTKPVSSNPHAHGKNVEWDEEKDHFVVDTLLATFCRGEGSNGGFKEKTYSALASGLKKICTNGGAFTIVACKNRVQKMKEYQTAFKLRNMSGFPWNDETGCADVAPDVWEPYVKSHPVAKVFCTKGLPLFSELDELFGSSVANGNGTFHPTLQSSCQGVPLGDEIDDNDEVGKGGLSGRGEDDMKSDSSEESFDPDHDMSAEKQSSRSSDSSDDESSQGTCKHNKKVTAPKKSATPPASVSAAKPTKCQSALNNIIGCSGTLALTKKQQPVKAADGMLAMAASTNNLANILQMGNHVSSYALGIGGFIGGPSGFGPSQVPETVRELLSEPPQKLAMVSAIENFKNLDRDLFTPDEFVAITDIFCVKEHVDSYLIQLDYDEYTPGTQF
ncbi:hypothetical protein DL93DRAFT_2174375 [Clavulina sp. PMI_390]|nr:hypothetical protein DL93DRAFT_2174375 [Clavulina sp. PMI_390]